MKLYRSIVSMGAKPNIFVFAALPLGPQTLRCFGTLVAFVILCLLLLLLIRLLFKPPSFVFRKLLHVTAFTGVSLMILAAGSWQAAALTSGLLALILFPVLTAAEQTPWFAKLLAQKTPGEVRRSMLLLFLMFAAVIGVAWGAFGRAVLAAAAILMWGAGDAAAALVGIPRGKHKVRCRFTDGKKSWEGSLAMLGTSFLVGLLVLRLGQGGSWPLTLLGAGAGALVGAVTELFSPGEYDTMTVPAAILLVLLGLWTIGL